MLFKPFLASLLFLLISVAVFVSADDGTGNIACDILPTDIELCDDSSAVLPDLLTVVPKHLGIQNMQKGEYLRFSNGLANLGFGPWWLEPGTAAGGDGSTCQDAYQILPTADQFAGRQIQANGVPADEDTFVSRCRKGKFDFHETHNHWHIANVGQFKICRYEDFISGDDSEGKAYVDTGCAAAELPANHEAIGIKFTFCLIDWYKLADNSPTSDSSRNFWDCATGFQGITPQWVDQYHQATDGQDIEITGLDAGRYVLVSTVNSELFGSPVFDEMNPENNTSWVVFDLLRSSNGNPQLRLVEDACSPHYSYVADQLAPAVEQFVDEFHNGDARMAAMIIDDMCGGKAVNR